MSHWDFGRSPAEQYDEARPAGPFGPGFLPGQQADGGELPGGGPWPAAQGGPADWAGQTGEDSSWDDGWDDGDDPGPYPVIYERDPYYAAPAGAAEPAAPVRDAGPPPPAFRPAGEPGPGDPARDDTVWEDWALGRRRRLRRPGGRWRRAGQQVRADRASRPGPGGRRWLMMAAIALAAAVLGAAAVLLTRGYPGTSGAPGEAGSGAAGSSVAPSGPAGVAAGSPPGGSASPGSGAASGGPLTLAQAQAVVAGYTSANNAANAQRSDARLAAIETGSSEAIDAGIYQQSKATGAAPYPPFQPARATYYLPRGETASGPRWFVAEVANALTANPAAVISTEYLLFTQQAAGAPWLNAIEPYLLAGAGGPAIALGPDGLATAVGPDSTAQTVSPGRLPALTAASLDGASAGQSVIAAPGNLADSTDQRLWRKDVPTGTVTDGHTAAAGTDGQEFALLTVGGGALVFYTDAAQLTVTAPPGTVLHVTIPGYYSPSQPVAEATVSYLEQFAADDPASGQGAPRVIGDYSAITGKN